MNQQRAIIGGVAATVLLGVVGAAAAGEVLLLQMPEPRTRRGRAWRLFGLTALTAGLLAGGVVGSYVAARDAAAGDSFVISVFAFMEGGLIAGFAGLLLGSVLGAVLALDRWHREARP